ncbi:MAG: DUF342 domain-containing protein [Planctomycetes bacterium]|nr:DUF342 domain-containing protein [Planctomycetota bacterium]
MNESAGRIRVEVAKDRLSATLAVRSGPAAERASLEAALQRAGLRAGIDAAVVDAATRALADAEGVLAPTVVARGTAPSPGVDGRMELLFATGPLAGRLREDGSFDFRDRDVLCAVRTGDVLARYHPATRGRDGVDVGGARLPARHGAERAPRPGRGVERVTPAESGQPIEYRARDSGVVVWVEGSLLDVNRNHTHDGDVNLASGSLDTEGSLTVKGDVLPGFTAAASGDVVVRGHVTGGIVEAGGNATILGGVTGVPAPAVLAGGDIACHHAQEARLECGGTLRLSEFAMHCRIRARAVLAERGHGRVAGGEATFAERLRVREAGSPAAVPTLLAGADSRATRTDSLEVELVRHRQERRVRKIAGLPAAAAPDTHGKELRAAVQTQDQALDAQVALRRAERELLLQAEVVVLVALHPGVVVRLGPKERRIERPSGPCRITYDPAEDALRLEPLP